MNMDSNQEERSEMDMSSLASLIISNSDFTKLSNKFDDYCPFEALSVARLEIRHSNFLSDIIDPNRPHGFGDRCLRAFLEALLEPTEEHDLRLLLHLADLSEVEIRREWKNIDLLIRIPAPPTVIAIEMKVEAKESEHQLEDYERKVAEAFSGYKKLMFFVTPTGTEPSSKNSSTWKSLSFDGLIQKLEKAYQSELGSETARMMLNSYIEMLRRRYVVDDDKEQLAIRIWKKHRGALEYLMERRPNPMRDLCERISGPDVLKIINDEISNRTKCKKLIALDSNTTTAVRFYVPDWDEIPEMKTSNWTSSKRILLCEVELYNNFVGIRWVIGKGDAQSRERIFESIRTSVQEIGSRQYLSPDWKRINSESIIPRSKKEDDLDLEKIYPLVIKKISEYFVRHIDEYDMAMSALKPTSNT
jgi:hypothetical protein